MNNETYGLTIGQASPTTVVGESTKSTPFGNIETPLNPVAMAIVSGATYVARAFSAERKQLTELMINGMQHKGFAFIDVISPCLTWKDDEIFDYWKERVNFLEDHDTVIKPLHLNKLSKQDMILSSDCSITIQTVNH